MRRIGRHTKWHLMEEKFLIENYNTMTIKELQKGLQELSERKLERSADSINAKIKRLKAINRIEGQKERETVNRSLIQRRKNDI